MLSYSKTAECPILSCLFHYVTFPSVNTKSTVVVLRAGNTMGTMLIALAKMETIFAPLRSRLLVACVFYLPKQETGFRVIHAYNLLYSVMLSVC